MRLNCFVSYAHVDREFVRHEIVPVLEDIGLDVWIDYEQIPWGEFVPDAIMEGIRDAHLIVAVLNRRSTYVNFEVGAALGQAKPTLAVLRDEAAPSELRSLTYIRWSDLAEKEFRRKFTRIIKRITTQPIDKSIYNAAATRNVIGIVAGTDYTDAEEQLRFTADFLSLVKRMSGATEINLNQTRKGSFSSFLSLDLKPRAKLIEKIVFCIPEWKKKKLENLKLQAEIEKTAVETQQLRSIIAITERNAKIEDAKAMLQLYERYQELGITVQFGDEILLSIEQSGQNRIGQPERT